MQGKSARGRALRVLADVLPESVIFQHGSRRSRQIALTFDDGPGPLTPDYLGTLERAQASATFFVIGERCATHRRELAEMTRGAHEVAGHGWSHTPFTKLGSGVLFDELERTRALLPAVADGNARRRRMVRPPFGKMTVRSLMSSFRAGYASAMWSFDPLDWQKEHAEDVIRAVDPTKLRGGDIVLLHEQRRATLDALPTVIERLQAAGFELVTVSTLLAGSR